MLGMTGYSDYRELAQTLFQVVAMLEIEGQAYMNTDQAIIAKFSKGERQQQACLRQSLGTLDQENDKADRLQTYLDMIKEIRANENSKSAEMIALKKSLKDA